MDTQSDIATAVQAAIGQCENYHLLGDKNNGLLLQKVCLWLLRQAIHDGKIQHQDRLLIVGPETMGAKMVRSLQDAANDGRLHHVKSVAYRRFTKSARRAGAFDWNVDPSMVHRDSKIIWIDDTLRRGEIYGKTAPLILSQGFQVHAVAVLQDANQCDPSMLGVQTITSLWCDQ